MCYGEELTPYLSGREPSASPWIGPSPLRSWKVVKTRIEENEALRGR